MIKKQQSKKITPAAAAKIAKGLADAARRGSMIIDTLVDLIAYNEDPTLYNEEFGDHYQIKLFRNQKTKESRYDLRFSTRTGTFMTISLNQVKLAIAKAQAQGWPAYLYKPLPTPESDASVAYFICLPSSDDIHTQTRQQWQREFLVTALKKCGKGKTKFKVLCKFFTFCDQPILEEVLAHFSLRWHIKEGEKNYLFTRKKK